MIKQNLVITDPAGLHARPVSVLAAQAKKFSSKLSIEFKNKKTNLESVLGVMGLGVSANTEITLYAEGDDEEEALTSLVELMRRNQVAREN
jgi:phosphocarrier protein HPr